MTGAVSGAADLGFDADLPAQPVLDCHVHAWAGAPVLEVPTGLPLRPVPARELLAVWRQHGVDGGVIVQPSWLGHDHRDLLATLALAPLRLRGVAVLDPLTTSAADVAAMTRAGVCASRFNVVSSGPLPDFGKGGWPALIDAIGGAGWHLELLAPAAILAECAERLADLGLPLVLDHFAMPEPGTAALGDRVTLLERIATRVPLHVKLSAPYNTPLVDHAALARLLVSALGQGALLPGSNFPFPRHEATRNFTEEWALLGRILAAAGLTRAGLSANAMSCYGFVQK